METRGPEPATAFGRQEAIGAIVLRAATKNVDAIALRIGEDSYRYGELLSRTADYQEFGRRIGLGTDDLVVFDGPASLDFYAALLASVLGSFVTAFANRTIPLTARIRSVENLKPVVIIGEELWLRPLGPRHCSWFRDVPGTSQAIPDINPTEQAYLSTTSGTMGMPTCAFVDPIGLARFLTWVGQEFEMSPDDRWFEAAEPSSDLAITNALIAFSAGASFCVAPPEARYRLGRTAEVYRPTILRTAPAVAALLLQQVQRRPVALPELRILGFGGDVLPASMPRRLLEAVGSCAKTVNTYGKTETAGFVVRYWFDADSESRDHAGRIVPIGSPVPGVSVSIRPLESVDGIAESDVGELVIRSPAVALRTFRASLPRHEMSKKPEAGAMAVLPTGDLVRQQGSGLQFVGRVDREIKINGFRVQLEQLEATITEAIGCPTCMIHDGKRLTALVEGRAALSVGGISELLEGVVPPSLLPRSVVMVGAIPHNKSGKYDLAECSRIVAERATE